jgi:tripartite-type tricarboxylate transporter receptor subunit TctC
MSALSRRLMAGLALSALPGLHAGAQQPWPNRPVRVVVGYPPGGAADVAARLVAAHLTEALGAPFVLDNRPGASTIIAAEAAAKAAPDGYTLLFGSQSTMASVPVLFSARAGYDPGRDFVPVGLVCRAPFFVFVSAASPDADLRALLDRARARPGALTYGSNGAGAAGHLATELLLRDAGLRMTHVPYRSYVPAFTDLAGGRLDMVLGDLTAAGGAVQAGRLRLLAAVSPQRSAFAPEVPTAAEAAGLPPFEAGAWFGLFAPRGTPDAAVAALSAALRDYLATERAHTAFTGIGLGPLFASPEEVTALVRSDTERFGRLIREQGITAE